MPTFAAVDIGSNSVRLKIARATRGRLETLHEDREVTRLGESVFAGGSLDPQAMAHTIQVLQRFLSRHAGASPPIAFGSSPPAPCATPRTAALFLDWVAHATGWKVQVISGLEEGRLIHLGVLSNARIGNSRVLLIDLGGGSCELTLSDYGHIADMISLPIGAVRLTQTFLHTIRPQRN